LAANRWYNLGENTRYILGAKTWYIFRENYWYILTRKMTLGATEQKPILDETDLKRVIRDLEGQIG